jgi:hypothetical protein
MNTEEMMNEEQLSINDEVANHENASPLPFAGFTILTDEELQEIEESEPTGGSRVSEETLQLLSAFEQLEIGQGFLWPIPSDVNDSEKYRRNIKTRFVNHSKSADVKVNPKDKSKLKIKRIAPRKK